MRGGHGYTGDLISTVLRRRSRGCTVVLAIYVCVALLTPVMHHDVACHLESKSHCDACAATSLASKIEVSDALVGHVGVAGVTASGTVSMLSSADTEPASGRAPPAARL